ncbi:hypothetical protein ACGFR8_34780 [Streptomyces brevispora]
MPDHTAIEQEDAPAPELPVALDMPVRSPTSSVPPNWSPPGGPSSTMG